MKALMTAFPAAVLESAEKMVADAPPDVLDAAATVASSRNSAAGNPNMAAYHREFLQNCVEDAMDDFCSDLRRQMWHLHYDMVRSFQLQQGRIAGLFNRLRRSKNAHTLQPTVMKKL